MTDILIQLAVAAALVGGFVALVLALLHELHDDGAHAHRPPPNSHHPDLFDPSNDHRPRVSL